MSTEEAQKIIDDFFTAYPGIKNFVEKEQEKAKKRGYTETAWGRRRYIRHITEEPYEFTYNELRPVDFNPLLTVKSEVYTEVSQERKEEMLQKLLSAKNYYNKKRLIAEFEKEGISVIENTKNIEDAKRQCVNAVVQGSAADITKIAMIRLGTNEELKKLGFRMLFPIHDEVLAECPFENRKRCAELMSQIMIDSAKPNIDVPMKCDVEGFFYWYGPDVDLDSDDEATLKQYNDFVLNGLYKEKSMYTD